MTTSGIIISPRKIRTKCGTILNHKIKPYQSIGDGVIIRLTIGGKLIAVESISCSHELWEKRIKEKHREHNNIDYSQLDSVE